MLCLVQILLILSVSFVQYVYSSINTVDADELSFVHTICRHGDRTIQKPYASDPYISEEYWPEGWAQLTNVGKQQHYELGQYLRKRYESLIGNGKYSSDNVYVWSTDVKRVLLSAEANLAGLFPPTDNQKWNRKLGKKWQRIPVHTEPRSQDFILSPQRQCDRFDYEMTKYLNSTEYKELFIKHKALISNLEEHTGLKLQSLVTLAKLHDTFYVEKLKGYTLPQWAENVMNADGEFEYLFTLFYAMFTKTTDMKKLSSGYLLKEMLDRFTNKTQSTLSPDRSMWLYFAHDTTIANMLSSLGLFKIHGPPYASCLFFELYKSDDAPYVQLFYRYNSTLDNLPPLKIPGCEEKCPLDRWYEIYNAILPTGTYESECALRNGEFLPPNGNTEKFQVYS